MNFVSVNMAGGGGTGIVLWRSGNIFYHEIASNALEPLSGANTNFLDLSSHYSEASLGCQNYVSYQIAVNIKME
jgi:hypothetical protein